MERREPVASLFAAHWLTVLPRERQSNGFERPGTVKPRCAVPGWKSCRCPLHGSKLRSPGEWDRCLNVHNLCWAILDRLICAGKITVRYADIEHQTFTAGPCSVP